MVFARVTTRAPRGYLFIDEYAQARSAPLVAPRSHQHEAITAAERSLFFMRARRRGGAITKPIDLFDVNYDHLLSLYAL
jgi:hypothetical protein